MPFLEFEPVLAHDFADLLHSIRQYVEKRAYALAHEKYSATILIGLHRILDAGFSQRRLKPQSLFQFLGDVNEVHLLVLKKAGVAAHSLSILSRSVIFKRT